MFDLTQTINKEDLTDSSTVAFQMLDRIDVSLREIQECLDEAKILYNNACNRITNGSAITYEQVNKEYLNKIQALMSEINETSL